MELKHFPDAKTLGGALGITKERCEELRQIMVFILETYFAKGFDQETVPIAKEVLSNCTDIEESAYCLLKLPALAPQVARSMGYDQSSPEVTVITIP